MLLKHLTREDLREDVRARRAAVATTTRDVHANGCVVSVVARRTRPTSCPASALHALPRPPRAVTENATPGAILSQGPGATLLAACDPPSSRASAVTTWRLRSDAMLKTHEAAMGGYLYGALWRFPLRRPQLTIPVLELLLLAACVNFIVFAAELEGARHGDRRSRIAHRASQRQGVLPGARGGEHLSVP